MTNQQFQEVLMLIKALRKIKTWTTKKHSIVSQILEIITSGRHERFISHYRIHGKYVGLFYLNDKTHNRQGTLKNFRGNNIMVLCYKRGIGQNRFYIVCPIDGDIEIPKTNQTKINQGWQLNILKWRINLKTGKAVE